MFPTPINDNNSSGIDPNKFHDGTTDPVVSSRDAQATKSGSVLFVPVAGLT